MEKITLTPADEFLDCESCGVTVHEDDAHTDESGSYCEDCRNAWLDEQVREFAYLLPMVRAQAAHDRAYAHVKDEPDFAWMDEHDSRL